MKRSLTFVLALSIVTSGFAQKIMPMGNSFTELNDPGYRDDPYHEGHSGATIGADKSQWGNLYNSISNAMNQNPDNNKQWNTLKLDSGWSIQSSSVVSAKGIDISSVTYDAKTWIAAKVPSTVLGTLADNGIVKDPYFSKNLDNISRDGFKSPWWYRKEFTLTGNTKWENASLCFEGINYKANVWVNGKLVASADTIKGAFRVFELNVTQNLTPGKNVIAVEVIPPLMSDYYIGFVDWAPRPMDENMGLFRPVSIKFCGSVSIRNLFVRSTIDLKSYKEAALTIEADIYNNSKSPCTTIINGRIDSINIEFPVSLKAMEHKHVVVDSTTIPALKINNPRLWWPYQYGKPDMHTLELQSIVNGLETDRQTIAFGIREVSKYINKQGNVSYKVNGKDIQIRGGGWSDDLFLRENDKNLEAQVQYVKLMNLNAIRLEGFWGSSQKLYDLCDQYGILLMPGWSCQWEWKHLMGSENDDFGTIKSEEDMDLVARMMRDQIVMFRNHPSIYVWVQGSDKSPRTALEKRYLDDLKIYDPTRTTLLSCANLNSTLTGPSGVKMEGPYDYVTPNYWYEDKKHGGAYGFNTETGPGPQIPPIESLKKMLPADKLWPINDYWLYHCNRCPDTDINRYVNALNKRYGEAKSLDEFLLKAQMVNYEAMRPMFEAFAVNKSYATGVIQWMLNTPWPTLYWQLYDHYLMPNGAFFGAMAGCKTLNVIYNYGDGNIWASNDLYENRQNLTALIRVFDINSKEILNQKVSFTIDSFTSKKIFDMPAIQNLSTAYFLDLKISDNNKTGLSRNFYWLSTKKEVLDEENSTWFYTPNKVYADFTDLTKLKKTAIETTYKYTSQGNKGIINLKLKNPSKSIVFFIEMKLKDKKSGEAILPVFWSNNYVSLLPGEEREFSVSYYNADIKGDKPLVEMNGYNLLK